MEMKQIPVIIDCDPGVDDVIALVLAFGAPEVHVLGITTVNGNSTVENTTRNAARACRIAGVKTPVFSGAEKPLYRDFTFDPAYCGADGLCDIDLAPDTAVIQPQSALSFLTQTLREAAEPVTIVSIASMTNLAQLLMQAPELKTKIKEIVTIAGYYWLDPDAGRAEWNVLYDPEAAKLVFDSGVPVRALGLDVTAKLRLEHAQLLLEQSSHEFERFLQHSLQFITKKQMNPAGILVDAMAVAATIRPELARYRRGRAQVNPTRSDAHLMEFTPCADGNVLAAEAFDFSAYMNLFRKQEV